MDASAGISAALEGLSPEDRAAYEKFAAITDPIEQAAAITAWGRPRGNLRQPFTGLRIQAVDKARADAERDGRKLKWVARRVGFDLSRLSRLSSKTTAATEAVA